jgi:hypothetical protein
MSFFGQTLTGHGASQAPPQFTFTNGNISYWLLSSETISPILITMLTSHFPVSSGATTDTGVYNVANPIVVEALNTNNPGIWTLVSATPPPPVAANEAVATTQNTALSIHLTAGASGNPTSAALVPGTLVGGTVTGFPNTTVTFTPTTRFTGTGGFNFTLANAGGTSNTATATISIGLPPQIIFFDASTGQNINVTGTTRQNPQTAVVGQQINLSVLTSQPAQTQSWSISGNPIGGYTPTPQSFQTGKVLPLTTSPTSTTFYWTQPTSSMTPYVVTYGPSTAYFAVTAAPTVSDKDVKVTYGTPNQNWIYSPQPGVPGQLDMGFGNPSGSLGIMFETFINPMAGTFEWVQLVQLDSILKYKGNVVVKRCTFFGGGLDAIFPYDIGSTADDSPRTIIDPGNTKLFRSFGAQMFLMWQSIIPNSIPVPLGSSLWGFAETSHTDPRAPLGWSIPQVLMDNTKFFQSGQYPLWNNLSTERCN